MHLALGKQYLILFLLFILTGCEFKSFINVKKSTSTPDNVEAIQFASASKIKIETKKNRAAYFSYLDNTDTLRTIDLGVEAQTIETVAYSDNIWVFSAAKSLSEAELADYPSVEYENYTNYIIKDFYYIKLNDANPSKVKFSDSTELPCRESLIDKSLVIHNGFIYCADQNLRLLKTDVSDFTQKNVYSNVVFRSEDDRENDRTFLEIIELGGKKFIVLKPSNNTRFALEASLFIENGNLATEIINVGEINTLDKDSYQMIADNLVTISNNGIATIVRNDNSVVKITLSEIQRQGAGYLYYINHAMFINSDAFFVLCNESSGQPDGIYRYDFSSPMSPVMSFYSLGDIECMNIQKIYRHADKMYIRTLKKGKNAYELYRFDKDLVGSKIEKIMNLSGAAVSYAYSTLFESSQLLDPILKTDTHLCFSGLDNNSYFPYCIDSNHQLNKVPNVSSSDQIDNQQIFKAVDNTIYFLTKNTSVRLNRFTLGNYNSSEVPISGANFNKEHIWYEVTSGQENEIYLINTDEDVFVNNSTVLKRQQRMLTGKSSYLGFLSYSSANLKVEITEKESTDIYDFSNTSWTKLAIVKKYQNKYYAFLTDESNAEIYLLSRNTKKALNIKVHNHNFSYIENGDYLYIIDRTAQLYEVNMKTDAVSLVDKDVASFQKYQEGVFYMKNIPFEFYTYSRNGGKSTISHSISTNGFESFFMGNLVEIGTALFFEVRNDNFEYPRFVLNNGTISAVRASNNDHLNSSFVYSSDVKNNLAIISDKSANNYTVYNLSNGQSQEYVNNYPDVWSFMSEQYRTNVFPTDLTFNASEAHLAALKNEAVGISAINYRIPNYLNDPFFASNFNANEVLYFAGNDVYYLLYESQFKGQVFKLVDSDVPVKVLEFNSEDDFATFDVDTLMAFYPPTGAKSSYMFSLDNKIYFSYPIIQNGKLASSVYELKENAQSLSPPMILNSNEGHVQLNLNLCEIGWCSLKFNYRDSDSSWAGDTMFKSELEFFLFDKEKIYPMLLNSQDNGDWYYQMLEDLNNSEEISRLEYLFIAPS